MFHARVRQGLVPALVLAAPAFLSVARLPADEPAPAVKIGDAVRGLKVKDIRYVARGLADFGEKKAFVIAFTDARCPVAAKYLPRLNELWEAYRGRGVQFLAVYASPDTSIVEVAADALERKIAFPATRDMDQSAMRALGVQRTPEVAVLDGAAMLRYRGRIDEQFRVTGENPAAGRAYLAEAIEAVLAGARPAVEETEVDGCLIPLRRPPERRDVSYAADVAPILQKRCQECHRPDQQAPFSLLTYEDAAGYADTIREVVEEGRMPPFFRDPRHGEFENHPPLTPGEIETIGAWVAAGAPRGDAAREPPPIAWPAGVWQIGAPDLILEMPGEFGVPPTGYVDYQYPVFEHEFAHDTWVQAIQILPGNRRVVHHANLYAVPPKGGPGSTEFITGYVPGGDVTRYGRNAGIVIRKGWKLRLQIHYTTTGKEERDRTRVGLVFAKEKIRKRTRILSVVNTAFAIEPYHPAYEVRARAPFPREAVGIGLYVHMHLRGKDMTFTARFPDGASETLLSVPNYSFDWQIAYRWAEGARRFPAGTVIETVSHYDNSPWNPFNPDPSQTVREGQQTYQEMNYGFLFYVDAGEDLDLDIDPRTGRPLATRAF